MRLSPPLLALLLSLPVLAAEPFGIQVLDEVSGRGVPMVTLETVNGVRVVTDSAGWAAFDEPGLMRQRVFFSVRSPGYACPKDNEGVEGVALDTMPGTTAEVKVLRLNIADRLYRITGQGIYRDSTLLGREAPLPSPNQAGGVLAQSDVQVALFRGQLFWTWSDTMRASHPHSLIAGTSATSELPATNGLDPTQGIYFQYSADKAGELIPVLLTEEAGRVRLDGLVAVKDMAGTEHLLAHFTQTKADGQQTGHGIAELVEGRQFERLVVLGGDYTWQFPQGQAVRVTEGDRDHVYFAAPFAHVRVPATYEAMLTPSNYEALAWDEDQGEVRWQKVHPPIGPQEEARRIEKRQIKAREARCQIHPAAGGTPVLPVSGSIQWNALRKTWIFLFGTRQGEVYCARSTSIEGPWQKAVQVAAHPGHRFDAVCQLPAFDQEGGKIIYFQGTLVPAENSTPRYDGNALMYRLDLGDPRLTR